MNLAIRSATCLFAAMIVVMSTPAFAQVIPVNGGALVPPRITINSEPGTQFDPHVDGDLAVYSTITTNGSAIVETIEYYRFSTGIRSTVPTQPNFEDLLSDVDHERIVARMRERAKDHEEEIARRLATAEAELREAAKFDFRIESHTRDEDFAALLAIVALARARAVGARPG